MIASVARELYVSGCAGERHEALKALLPPINQFELEKKCSVTTLDSLPGSICQKTTRKLNDVLLGAKHFSFRSSFFVLLLCNFTFLVRVYYSDGDLIGGEAS